MLGKLLRGVGYALVEMFDDGEEAPEEPAVVVVPSPRRVYNIVNPVRCAHCRKVTKQRLLVGSGDEEGALVFFDSVRDAASWRDGIVTEALDVDEAYAELFEEE